MQTELQKQNAHYSAIKARMRANPHEDNGIDLSRKAHLAPRAMLLSKRVELEEFQIAEAERLVREEREALKQDMEQARQDIAECVRNLRETQEALAENAPIDLEPTYATIEQVTRFVLLQKWDDGNVTVKPQTFTLQTLMAKRRTRDIVLVRQMIFYLSKSLTNRSFPVIGKRLGGFDHTTVLHAVNKMADRVGRGEIKMNDKTFNLNEIGDF